MIRKMIEDQLTVERAATKLAVLCGSNELRRIAFDEAKRREAIMSSTDALLSVADDLMLGRLR